VSVVLRVLVLYVSLQYGLDLGYCTCIVEHESNWDRAAIGQAGEVGLTQILPSTGEWLAGLGDVEWDEDKLSDPLYNLTLFGIGQREGWAHLWSTHPLCVKEGG